MMGMGVTIPTRPFLRLRSSPAIHPEKRILTNQLQGIQQQMWDSTGKFLGKATYTYVCVYTYAYVMYAESPMYLYIYVYACVLHIRKLVR